MGLPLFVAPVESDLPSKAADKTGTPSPSRSNIRRHGRNASRERRAALRRHMSIRDRMNYNAPVSRLIGGSVSNRFIDPTLDELEESRQRTRPFREVLREVVRGDDRTRERFEEQLNNLFASTPPRFRDVESNPVDSTSSTDRLPSYRVGRVVASSDPSMVGLELPAIAGRIQVTRDSESINAAPSTRTLRRHRRVLPSFSTLVGGAERLGETTRNRDVNGLGDRERSLSPEVWDTLLTTLTPDPQPPSSGSSFASTVASQNAGVPSSTTLTTPVIPGSAVIDQACDSGCENSDTEDVGVAAAVPNRGRREAARSSHRGVPNYDIGGPVDGPTDGPFGRRSMLNSETSDSRSARPTRFVPYSESIRREARMDEDATLMDMLSQNAPTSQAYGSQGNRRETRADEDTVLMDMLNRNSVAVGQRYGPPGNRRIRSGWIGHLFVGNPGEEPPTEGPPRSLYREGSTMSGNGTSQEEEEWDGMQRIVRSLARREDIPDEWWAEAGLSRTLPHEGTD